MAHLRSGKVRRPHKKSTLLHLHRLDGQPLAIPIWNIQQWDEHTFTGTMQTFVTVWYGLNMVPVRESFDSIEAAVNGTGVRHVK